MSILSKPNGKKEIQFSPFRNSTPTQLPCGQCIGCRLERSRQWAMRGTHEKQFHKESMFLTLTINPENMLKRGHKGLVKRDLQLFMKRLRKHAWTTERKKIRFIACGEYGPSKGRAHYHAIIYGYEFKDQKFWKHSKPNKFVSLTSKFPLFRSAELEKLWTMGFSTIGEVSFDTVAYVARYILKKVNGEKANKEYTYVDKETGEEYQKEYIVMSRRPGIGKTWLDKYESDLYPKDFVHIKGKKMRPPRYYDKLLEQSKPEMFKEIKAKRIKSAIEKENEDFKKPLDQKAPTLETQEFVRTMNQKNQTRSYEDETQDFHNIR